MKYKSILITILSIISFNCYSQTKYENGYYINNNDEKIACFILNNDWLNNPTEISLKYSENEPSKTETIESIKEFGINGKIKYQRYNVNIDRSSNLLASLDHKRNPVFKEEQLFLKVLIEGRANLYSYNSSNIQKFFFNIDSSRIEQLIYKSYLTNDNQIIKNNDFKQQIVSNLKCASISINEIQNIEYTSNKLINLFIEYNKCVNSQFSNYTVKEKKETFHLYLKAGLKSSSLEIKNSVSNLKNTDFGNKLGIKAGIEAEFILPFNNSKWGLLVEPTYQNFNSKIETTDLTSEVDYKSIEVPFGVRHYMFINENSRLFVNGLIIMDFDLNSKFDFKRQWESSLDIKSSSNLAFGFGYNYDEKYSIELRYHSSRDLLTNYVAWDTKYNSLSLLFGYSLF